MYCLLECILGICRSSQKPEGGTRSPRAAVTATCEPDYECRELSLSPLEDSKWSLWWMLSSLCFIVSFDEHLWYFPCHSSIVNLVYTIKTTWKSEPLFTHPTSWCWLDSGLSQRHLECVTCLAKKIGYWGWLDFLVLPTLALSEEAKLAEEKREKQAKPSSGFF